MTLAQSFKFLHMADLHLGSPLKGLAMRNAGAAGRIEGASREAFQELIDRALIEAVDFAVIAGDIYDGEWRDTSIGHFFNREISRLSRAGVPVFIVKGNHDAESEVTRALPLPQGVHVFAADVAGTVELDSLGVALHGRSFATRAVSENFALSYPPASPNRFNIGLLHTSLTGRPPHEPYAPCSLADLASRGYDYWALGHVHEFEVVSSDPHVVYPGNLQGRSIREPGAKGAVVVEVVDGRVAEVRRLIVDKARFELVEIDVSDADSEGEVQTRIRAALAPIARASAGKPVALRLRLTGTAAIARRLAALGSRLADEVQATIEQEFEEAFLEKLVNDSLEPGRAGPLQLEAETPLIDTLALIAGLEADEDLKAEAGRLIDEIAAKMPAAGLAREDMLAEIDRLMLEARTLVVARAGGGEA
ncbi:MAG: DNA repair exonuclease [Ancalomicrobiaceae bacterium]|nr:DNA repair exonuclease [Ancalomicrobiaceae bacterium]